MSGTKEDKLHVFIGGPWHNHQHWRADIPASVELSKPVPRDLAGRSAAELMKELAHSETYLLGVQSPYIGIYWWDGLRHSLEHRLMAAAGHLGERQREAFTHGEVIHSRLQAEAQVQRYREAYGAAFQPWQEAVAAHMNEVTHGPFAGIVRRPRLVRTGQSFDWHRIIVEEPPRPWTGDLSEMPVEVRAPKTVAARVRQRGNTFVVLDFVRPPSPEEAEKVWRYFTRHEPRAVVLHSTEWLYDGSDISTLKFNVEFV